MCAKLNRSYNVETLHAASVSMDEHSDVAGSHSEPDYKSHFVDGRKLYRWHVPKSRRDNNRSLQANRSVEQSIHSVNCHNRSREYSQTLNEAAEGRLPLVVEERSRAAGVTARIHRDMVAKDARPRQLRMSYERGRSEQERAMEGKVQDLDRRIFYYKFEREQDILSNR